ncbi:MAG: DUF4250 domain-containing protein [Aeromonadaceae bacterium]
MFSLTRFASMPAPMLVSLVNTQLRDHFDSLDDLVAYHDISSGELCQHLANANYHYDAAQNQFKEK